MCDLQCQHHADYVLQVERVVAQMVQGSEKISYIDLYERFIFFCRASKSKSKANHCVSPGLCSNFVFAIRTRAVGKKMIETFLSTYFFLNA